jgi:hypothetical protein
VLEEWALVTYFKSLSLNFAQIGVQMLVYTPFKDMDVEAELRTLPYVKTRWMRTSALSGDILPNWEVTVLSDVGVDEITEIPLPTVSVTDNTFTDWANASDFHYTKY